MKGLFKGLKYTLSNLSKKKVTYDYPNQPLPLPDRFRGIQNFIRRNVLFVISALTFVRQTVFS